MTIVILCQDKLLEIVTLSSVGTAGQTGNGFPQATRQASYNFVVHFIMLHLFQQAHLASRFCIAVPFFLQGP